MDLPFWLVAILIICLGMFTLGYVIVRRAPLYDDVEIPDGQRANTSIPYRIARIQAAVKNTPKIIKPFATRSRKDG